MEKEVITENSDNNPVGTDIAEVFMQKMEKDDFAARREFDRINPLFIKSLWLSKGSDLYDKYSLAFSNYLGNWFSYITYLGDGGDLTYDQAKNNYILLTNLLSQVQSFSPEQKIMFLDNLNEAQKIWLHLSELTGSYNHIHIMADIAQHVLAGTEK